MVVTLMGMAVVVCCNNGGGGLGLSCSMLLLTVWKLWPLWPPAPPFPEAGDGVLSPKKRLESSLKSSS